MSLALSGLGIGGSSSSSTAAGEQYAGAPGLACYNFLRQMHWHLNQHALQTGGNVQYTYMFSLLRASVQPVSGLVKPLEDFLQILAPTYLQDARQLTFDRARLISLPSEVARSLHQQYRGPPIMQRELEDQVLKNVGASQGIHSISKYLAGRSNQPPTPLTPVGATGGTGTSLVSRYESQVEEAKQDLSTADDQLQQCKDQLSSAKEQLKQTTVELAKQAASRETRRDQLHVLFEGLIEQQLQVLRDGTTAAQPAGTSAAAVAPADSPVAARTRAKSELKAGASVADPQDEGGSSSQEGASDLPDGEEGPPKPVHVPTPPKHTGVKVAAALRSQYRLLSVRFERTAVTQEIVRELSQEFSLCNDMSMPVLAQHLPAFMDGSDPDPHLLETLQDVDFALQEADALVDGHERQLKTDTAAVEVCEGRLQQARVQRHACQDRLQSVREQLLKHELSSTPSMAGAAMASGSGQLTAFEAYLHPNHPELLVTPGALVVLLMFELVRIRCAFMPGANSLRHDPPKQLYGKDSLVQYGQAFKEAAQICGQDDKPATHIQLYLQGLADEKLRQSYRKSLMKDPTRAPTTLEATIAAVEAMASGELIVLGQAAEVGGPAEKQQFRDKQMFVCPAVVSGSSAAAKPAVRFGGQLEGQGEVTVALVGGLFPSAKGNETAVMNAPCFIHAQGGGRPHKLADCDFAKKLSSMPLARAKQQLHEYQASRAARYLTPSASMGSWESEEPACSTAAGYADSLAPDGACELSDNPLPPLSAANPPADDPDTTIMAYLAVGSITAGANGLPQAVAATALGRNNQQYTRSAAVRQAYESACRSAPVPTEPLPTPVAAAPCPTCGRQQGHGQGICFTAHPDCAPEFWKGPLISDGPQAEKAFLQAVAQRRPHSRFNQAVAQGLVVPRWQNSTASSSGAGRPPPNRLLQRPGTLPRAAAAATVEHLAAHHRHSPGDTEAEGDYSDAEYGGEGGDLLSHSACAAQPVGFNVEDYATYSSKQQPSPGVRPLPIDHAAVSSQLQQALDKGDMSQQLYAVTQGMHMLVAANQQLQSGLQSSVDRIDTMEKLMSTHWHVPLPAKPAANNSTNPLSDPADSLAATAGVPSLHRPEQAVPDPEGLPPGPIPSKPPPNPAARAEWAQNQLDLALNKQDGSYVMDEPRHKDPQRGTVVLTPDGVCIVDLDSKFDTGCTVDIMSLQAAERAGIEWVPLPDPMGIRMANGSRVPLVGVTATFQVVLRSGTPHQLTTTVRALVLDAGRDGHSKLGYDLLLGKGWFAKHRITLALAEHRVTYTSDAGTRAYMLLRTKLKFQHEPPAVLSAGPEVCMAAVSVEVADGTSAPVAAAAHSDSDGDVPDLVWDSDGEDGVWPAVWGGYSDSEDDSNSLCLPASSSPRAAAESPRPRPGVDPATCLKVPSAPGCAPLVVPPCPAVMASAGALLPPGTVPVSDTPASQVGAAGLGNFLVGAAMAATGTEPSALLPNTQQACARDDSQRAWQLGQFNPLQDLDPVAEPDGPDPDLIEDPVHGWHVGADLTAEQRARLDAVLLQHKHVFAFKSDDLVGYTGSDGQFAGVHIPLQQGTQRVYEAERRYSQQHMAIQDEKCAELLRLGWIKKVPTTNLFASNSTCPGKKDEQGNWTDKRFCIDFRPLNAFTVADNYRMPLPEELFNSLGTPRYMTTLDLRSGFHQLPMHPDSAPLTAFWWRRELYAYTRMPFGLRNATAVFQRVVDEEMAKAGLSGCTKVFVDDMLIHSETFEDHLRDLAAVLDCLWRAGLRVHPRKSYFRNH